MSLDLFRDRPLFEASLDVCIQAGTHTDAKTTPLVFRIIEGTRQQPSSSQSEKIFHFELTDQTEPFFLYILDIGEYDFHNLKREQSIIVDFLAFPAKLIALLRTCISHSHNHTSSSTFSTTLDSNSGLFSVVESNEFKNLTHISLQLRPANDAALKAYLAARLNMSLEDAASLRAELAQAGRSNDEAADTITELNSAIVEMKSRLDHEVITMQAAHSNELSRLKMAHTDEMNGQKSAAEAVLSSLRAQSEAAISELRDDLEALQQQHSASEKQRSSAEYRVRELERDLSLVTAERDRSDSSAQQYSKALADRDAAILSLEREVASLRSKIEACKQQLQDKEEVISHAMGEKLAAEGAREEAMERTEMFSSAVEAMQEKLLAATSEMNRGNQMIKSQLREIDELREKVRVKNEVIRKQEAVVTDGRAQIADLSARLQNEVKSKETEQQRVEVLSREVEAGREKVAAGLETIERNKEIMNHLNEMITQLQMGGGGGMASPSWTSPSGAAASRAGASAAGADTYAKSYGFRVVSGPSPSESPDGPGGLYDALSPPVDGSSNLSKHSTGKSSGEYPEYPSSSEFSRKWTANRAMTDSISTRKYDSLVSSYPRDVTPASTSGSRKGLEEDGYYRGLPIGSTSLTPSITGEGNMFLRGSSSQQGSVAGASSRADRDGAPRQYHWQADDFGLDETEIPVA